MKFNMCPDNRYASPHTCIKCGLTVQTAVSISWDEETCPDCYRLVPITQTKENENPLLTKAKVANPGPIAIYLDIYTICELRAMRNV